MNKINQTKSISTRRSVHILIPLFYLLTLATHLLIISTIIPYHWVNGGNSPSYEAQAAQSAVSIVITSLLFLFIWKVANKKINPKAWQRRALYALTALWIIGFIMQLLGTPFERYVLSLVLLVGIVGHIQLIRELSKSR